MVRVRIDATDALKLTIRAESKASTHYDRLLDAWRERLPADTAALWAFIASADTSALPIRWRCSRLAIELRAGQSGGILSIFCCRSSRHEQVGGRQRRRATDHVRKDVVIDAIMEVSPALDQQRNPTRSKKDAQPYQEDVQRQPGCLIAWWIEPCRRPAEAIAAE